MTASFIRELPVIWKLNFGPANVRDSDSEEGYSVINEQFSHEGSTKLESSPTETRWDKEGELGVCGKGIAGNPSKTRQDKT